MKLLLVGALAGAVGLTLGATGGGMDPAAGTSPGTSPAVSATAAADRPAVTEVRTLGTTVRGRAIRAFRLGDPAAKRTVVLIGVMHGSEKAPGQTLRTLRDSRRAVAGVDLWVVPVLNPDGWAAGRRTNARGVDLNRNFPHRWSRTVRGAGSKAASERETRAVMQFLNRIDPDVVVSLHQPFGVVDTSVSKRRGLAGALSRALHLPRRKVDCGGPCHGTLTGWFNATHAGEAITVEFGRHPSRTYLRRTAVRGLLAAVGARFTR